MITTNITMKLMAPAIVPLLGLLLFMPQAKAGAYKWIDKDGTVVYSQRPPPEGPFEALRLKTTPAPKQAPAQKPPAAFTQALGLGTTPEDERKLQAELAKVQALREKNCAIARQQLKIYTVYKRIQGRDGQARRITDQEREAGLTEASQGIKDYCD